VTGAGSPAAGPGSLAAAAPTTRADDREAPGRWSQLAVVGVGVLLAFAPWFSAAAVGPLLQHEWQTTALDLPLLTVAVQVGFAVAAIGLALSGAADAIAGPRLFVVGSALAAAGNLGFALLADSPGGALLWRAVTGAGLAAVYPVAVRMLSGWFRRERGVAIGVHSGA
jgi:MFS family permease